MVGAASAQVTISGSIGVGIQNTMSDSKARFHLTDADINFSGSEDLGGGLSISAATSISMENLRGARDGSAYTATGDSTAADGVTNNNTTLTLAGGFGSLYYKNVLSGAIKMGDISVEDDMSDKTGGYSTVNVIGYGSPEIMPGLTVGAEWAGGDWCTSAAAVTATSCTLGKRTDTAASGTPTLIMNYASGPLSVYLDQDPNKAKGWDLRVKYDAGIAQVALRTSKDKQQEVGFSMPMGAMTVDVRTANLTVSGAAKKVNGIGLKYALSKQTSASFGYVSAKGAGNNYRLNLVKAF